MKNIGERIRLMRQTRGLSQAGLAKKCGLQPTAISHFESGNRSPSIANLLKLCEALSCPSDYIIGRINNHPLYGNKINNIMFNMAMLKGRDIDVVATLVESLTTTQRKG